MKNFGKFNSVPENVSLPPVQIGIDETGEPVFGPERSVTVLFFRNEAGEDICQIAKDDPFKFYIAVHDDGVIFSMTDDIEHSQIANADIIGIDEDFGFTFGQGGTVYGKIWNGIAIVEPAALDPVPDEISRRQFFQQLANDELITKDEAKAALQGGAIPVALQALITQLPEEEQFDAEMLLIGAATFARAHPLCQKMRVLFDWSNDQLDSFWRCASKV
ncbi:hypothetical protein CQ054_07040 [Ochrobactrum sp. MYb29]|nr:hypothetical protein CQ054_07040 [Ochrobactrum sp. MYb29]